MNRAGMVVRPLTMIETQTIYEVVLRGDDVSQALRRLPDRNRATVFRAYNVIAQFHLRNLSGIDDETSKEIASAARYSTTVSYVQGLFLRWMGFKNRFQDMESTSFESMSRNPIPGIDGLADSILDVSEPRLGYWDHLGRADSALLITLEVRAIAHSERDCRATLTIESPHQISFPLHWAGHPYSLNESDPDFIEISPGVPARLDVAFIPKYLDSRARSNLKISRQTPIGDSELAGLRGLVDWDNKGCWIAQPYALSQPRPRTTAFLPPGEHLIRIEIYVREDVVAFEEHYMLMSPERPEELAITVHGQ